MMVGLIRKVGLLASRQVVVFTLTALTVFLNGKDICDSRAHYAIGGHGMGSLTGAKTAKRELTPASKTTGQAMHINSQGGCTFGAGIPIQKGDRLWIKSFYDFGLHPG